MGEEEPTAWCLFVDVFVDLCSASLGAWYTMMAYIFMFVYVWCMYMFVWCFVCYAFTYA